MLTCVVIKLDWILGRASVIFGGSLLSTSVGPRRPRCTRELSAQQGVYSSSGRLLRKVVTLLGQLKGVPCGPKAIRDELRRRRAQLDALSLCDKAEPTPPDTIVPSAGPPVAPTPPVDAPSN